VAAAAPAQAQVMFTLSSLSRQTVDAMLDNISNLSPAAGRLLYRNDSDDVRIEIREYENIRWLHIGGEAIQAAMNVALPDQLILPINIAMLSTLLFYERPTKLLNLGFGIGCFERFFMARIPNLRLTSVESNASIIRLAKKYFFIPDDYPVVNDNADHFLRNIDERYSIILCDIFENERNPSCLSDSRFYYAAYRALDANGVLAVNLLALSESDLIAVLLEVRRHFAWVLLLQIPNFGNLILIALKNEPPPPGTIDLRAERLSEKLAVDLRRLPAQLQRLPSK